MLQSEIAMRSTVDLATIAVLPRDYVKLVLAGLFSLHLDLCAGNVCVLHEWINRFANKD